MAGYLLLCGGGEFQKGQEQADQYALQQAGGSDVTVLILAAGTTASTAANNGANWFRSLGASSVEAVTLTNHTGANRPDLAAMIAGASLVYLASGSPAEWLGTLRDSLVFESLREAFANGLMLAAAGAGGMVLMEHLYDPASGKIGPGLGLFPNTIFVPQYNAAGRKWAQPIQKALPQTLLIGIDEKVAIGGKNNDWQVFGRGWVTIFRQGKPYKYQGGQPFKMIP